MAKATPNSAKAAAKKTADSLLVLIKDKNVTFNTLVKTISDDKGSIDKVEIMDGSMRPLNLLSRLKMQVYKV